MTQPALNATPRHSSLAETRGAGLLPFTITDIRGRAIQRHAASLMHEQFAALWRQRTAQSTYAVTGLDAPMRVAITAFNYCPVSHVVIHVLAVAFDTTQYHIVPVIDGATQTVLTSLPVVCRKAPPTAVTAPQRTHSMLATVETCSLPPGVLHAAFARDLLVPAAGAHTLPQFFYRAGYEPRS